MSLSGSNQGTATRSTVSTTRSASSGIGETPGALSVSLTGGANYTVPIAVPPGIAGVAPEIAISYNSQGSNGIAGWGWGISGLSTITRIPATKYHDGVLDPVDFDNKDRFALDGQRLMLKGGSYGANGAIYQTEKYSNLKITSHGTSPYGAAYGPAYFTVLYPDGSKAHYGLNGGRSQLEYAITNWDNSQGIRINYYYKIKGNDRRTLSIDKITYGAKASAAPINEIKFEYHSRERGEHSNAGGLGFVRKSLLKKIKVTANGTAYRN
ncbi:SpvB/TcaC N-terminal domain-containing protein, partial [Aquimarina sediminis]|uniref:SpvB/TcaC N-terminal domain-containing protein n=1 Tax=Aquimarina sediminis TaxID=2070536 RepID=UPI002936DA8D